VAATFATVDDYIASFAPDVQEVLRAVRKEIRRAVPDGRESMSYHMPTITLDDSYLLSFAAWKRHIGLYPAPSGDEAFEREMAPYRAARSTARFPLAGPMPYPLIGRAAALLAEQRSLA
jgi:uncharacterized protein YdhG (YjbR/CyaY superfamily)